MAFRLWFGRAVAPRKSKGKSRLVLQLPDASPSSPPLPLGLAKLDKLELFEDHPMHDRALLKSEDEDGSEEEEEEDAALDETATARRLTSSSAAVRSPAWGSAEDAGSVAFAALSRDRRREDGSGKAATATRLPTPGPDKRQRSHKLLLQRFFHNLSDELLTELYGDLVWKDLEPGEMLFDFGDLSDPGMFIVISGSLTIYGHTDIADSVNSLFHPVMEPRTVGRWQHHEMEQGYHSETDEEDSSTQRPEETIRHFSAPGTEPILDHHSHHFHHHHTEKGRHTEDDGIIELHPLVRGDLAGEMELLLGCPRTQRIVTHTGCALLQMTRNTFLSFARRYPQFGVSFTLTTVAKQWKLATAVIHDFLKLPIPRVYEPPSNGNDGKSSSSAGSEIALDLERLVADNPSRVRTLRPGDRLNHTSSQKSTSGERMFIVLSGTIRARTVDRGSAVQTFRFRKIFCCDSCVASHLSPIFVFFFFPFIALLLFRSLARISRVPQDAILGAGLHPQFGCIHHTESTQPNSGSLQHCEQSVRIRALGLGHTESTALPVSFLHHHLLRLSPPFIQFGWRLRSGTRVVSCRVELCERVTRSLALTISKFRMLGFRHEIRRAGSILYKQGDLSSHLYIIVSGKVRVYEDRHGDQETFSSSSGKLGSGLMFTEPKPDPDSPYSSPDARWLSQENIRLEVGRGMCVGEGAMLRSGGQHQMFQQIQDSERPLGAGFSATGHPPLFRVQKPPKTKRGFDSIGTTTDAESQEGVFEFEEQNSLGSSTSRTAERDELLFPERATSTTQRSPIRREITRSVRNAKMGLGSASRHQFTAVAVRDAELISIAREPFWLLLAQRFPSVLGRFTQILAERMGQLMSTDRFQMQSRFGNPSVLSTTVAVIPADPMVDVDMFCIKLERALQLHDRKAFRVTSSIAARLLGFSKPQPPPETPALNSSTGDDDDDDTGFGEELKQQDQMEGEDSPSQFWTYSQRSRVVNWLSEVERANRFIIFQASQSPKDLFWNRLCVRSADCIFILADAASEPGVDTTEHQLLWAADAGSTNCLTPTASSGSPTLLSSFGKRFGWSRSSSARHSAKQGGVFGSTWWKNLKSGTSGSIVSFASKELVLLHPATTLIPKGTKHHLDCRPRLDHHHHVREDLEEHWARLARYLSGQTVCAVLGGGGARGLSHLGTMKAFQELEIPVDGVGGCSQGAFMAAVLAMEPVLDQQSLKRIEARVGTMAGKMGSMLELLRDATLPVLSYFSGRRFSQSIAQLLGPEVEIEDTWIPFFCVVGLQNKAFPPSLQ